MTTSAELIKDKSIWKNENGTWSRLCPQCYEIVNHFGPSDRRMKDQTRQAHVKKCVCVKCRAINKIGVELKPPPNGVWKDADGRWCRVCPVCNVDIFYKWQNSTKSKCKCIQAHKYQKPCKACIGPINSKISKTWTDEEELLLCTEGGEKLLHELSNVLDKHSPRAISIKRRRLGVKLSENYKSRAASYNRSLLNPDVLCKLDQTWTIDDLTNDEFQVLIGCQLGDGSIKKNGNGKTSLARNFTFYCCHVDPCMDYVDWKIKILDRFKPRRHQCLNADNKFRAELCTLSHPIFTNIRDKFYTSRYNCNKDIIPMDLIQKLDLFGLMIWYLDDGYLGVPQDGLINNARNPNGTKWHKSPSPHIVAKGYKYDDLVEVTNIFNYKFNLSLNVTTSKHRDGINKQINIPAVNRTRVLNQWRILAKTYNLPSCMYYKLNLHNQELLDRELACENKRLNEIKNTIR